eukprot:2870137-Pyramimonas_sp.AAC.1
MLTQTELQRLERWQTKKLRHLLRSPARVRDVPNEATRRKANVYSVTSTLLFRRLRWWQRVISPGLAPQEPEYDPAKAVGAVLFGRLCFERRVGPSKPAGRISLLLQGLQALWSSLSAAR